VGIALVQYGTQQDACLERIDACRAQRFSAAPGHLQARLVFGSNTLLEVATHSRALGGSE
jgi:hypothetical protein